MKLEVPFVRVPTNIKEDFITIFDQLTKNKIDQSSWGKVLQQPSVEFCIGHNNQAILLHYNVLEEEARAVYSKHHEPVYKDSCVEFFIAFDDSPNYYNFEFNCLGTCLSAYGPDRNDRKKLPTELINQIQPQTKIQREIKGKSSLINWQLTVVIPVHVFVYSEIKQLSEKNAWANFYKCGDELSSPHYLSWKMIKTPKPDFHQPSFFGELTFL